MPNFDSTVWPEIRIKQFKIFTKDVLSVQNLSLMAPNLLSFSYSCYLRFDLLQQEISQGLPFFCSCVYKRCSSDQTEGVRYGRHEDLSLLHRVIDIYSVNSNILYLLVLIFLLHVKIPTILPLQITLHTVCTLVTYFLLNAYI